jgi:hypothetical protein
VVLAEGVEVGSGRGTSVAFGQLYPSQAGDPGRFSSRVVSELAGIVSYVRLHKRQQTHWTWKPLSAFASRFLI